MQKLHPDSNQETDEDIPLEIDLNLFGLDLENNSLTYSIIKYNGFKDCNKLLYIIERSEVI